MPSPPDRTITHEQALALRRKLYRRAIPLACGWFLLIGIIAGALTGRWWLTIPLSIVAAIVISAWMAMVALRNIKLMQSQPEPQSRRRRKP